MFDVEQYSNNGSALLQRNTALRVRQTASLVSGHDKIRERQGSHWAADCKNRVIYWRVNHPFKQGEILNKDQVVWLTIHEAAHLVMSGSWDIPEPPIVDNKERFFRFWNAVEDIRIERWAKDRYPGKAHACIDLHHDMNDTFKAVCEDPKNPKLHIADQVGLNFLRLENQIETWGEKKAVKFSDEHWPEIQDIASTSRSSAEVAERLLPIYQKLMEIMPPSSGDEDEENRDGDVIVTLDEGGEGFRSTDKDGNPARLLSWKELLEGMAGDASGETKRRLIIQVQNEEQAKKVAEQLAAHGIGTEASGIEGSSNDWETTKMEQRGPINVLSRRIQSRLSHNSADQWEQRLKRGQFHSGRAHRSMQGNMRVFRKKSAIGKADYDFVFTIDMSGSQGGREKQLLASCVIASEAIEKAGMGLSIITWDSVMRHYKTWHSSIKMSQGIIGNDLAHAGGGTYEGYALRVAEEMIRPRLAMGRQVFLITMTDGQTTGVEESREIIRSLESKGVMTIGVGVMHPAPQHYTNKITVDTGEELANVLPNLLRSLIKRG